MLDAYRHRPNATVIASCFAIAVWSYWPTLTELVQTWRTDPQYSHGFLVPLFSLALLWQSRDQWAALTPQPSWFGMAFLVLAAAMRLAGAYIYSPWLEQISLLPALVGICLGLGGWRALALAGPAVAFLVFMIPLPGRLDKALA